MEHFVNFECHDDDDDDDDDDVCSGCDVGSRWHRLCDMSLCHINDHLSTFYDAHLLMAYLGASCSQHVDEFLQSLQHYMRHVVSSQILTLLSVAQQSYCVSSSVLLLCICTGVVRWLIY